MKTVFEIFAMTFSSVLSFVLGIVSTIAVCSLLVFSKQTKGNLTITMNDAETDISEEKEESADE